MINKLHSPRTSCNGAFAEVAIHWLSAVVSGWERFSQKSHFIGYQPWFTDGERFSQRSHFIDYQPWFPDGKNFRRSRIPLVVNRGFRMGKDFRRSHIMFFSPSPPHDFPCPFRIAIGLDTSLEALPTDSSLDSTSPARQTRGRLPASHSFRIATDSQPSAMASRRKDDRGTCVHFRFFRNRE